MKSDFALLMGNGLAMREPGACPPGFPCCLTLDTCARGSVLGTVLSILSGTCDIQFSFLKPLTFPNFSAKT